MCVTPAISVPPLVTVSHPMCPDYPVQVPGHIRPCVSSLQLLQLPFLLLTNKLSPRTQLCSYLRLLLQNHMETTTLIADQLSLYSSRYVFLEFRCVSRLPGELVAT